MGIGALEAGGTKMVLAIGNEKGEVFDKVTIPTKTPQETMPLMVEYFKKNKIESLGIGCFGPVDLRKESETYGYITSTPKLAWKNYNILGEFKEKLDIPVGFDTDVNAACLGEVYFGEGKNLENVVYITIGTGIGAGIFSQGKLLHGNLHPEAGHIILKRHALDEYEGKCPYHKDCFEGLASGPSIEARFGKPAFELTDQNKVWEIESYYIAQAIVNYIMILAPEKIILGGGVMHEEKLFPLIRKEVLKILAGYLSTRELENMEDYIVKSSLKDEQGIKGALILGLEACG